MRGWMCTADSSRVVWASGLPLRPPAPRQAGGPHYTGTLRPMRMLGKVVLALAAVAVTAAVVVSVTAQPRQTEPKPDDQRFQVKITDEMIRHSRIRDVLYFVGN